ncbi:MAG TPA: hypothetical protein VIK33_05280 [Anaerolineae bacterium]
MNNRSLFTADEWRTLQFAPLWVFTAVAGADRSVDEKEVAALAKEIADWALYKEPLVQEILLSVALDLSNMMAQYRADSRNVMTGLSNVADVLDRKATVDQAKNFKGAMVLLGRNIAQASGGGLFGAGDKMSGDEKAALGLIILSLRVS